MHPIKIILVLLVCTFTQQNLKSKEKSTLDIARSIEESNRDSCIQLFKLYIDQTRSKGDTLKAQYTQYELATIYMNGGLYQTSYDILWNLLLEVEHTDNMYLKAYIYTALGNLYLIFDQYENAHRYFDKTVSTYKLGLKMGNDKLSELGISYYYKALVFKAQMKLDSAQYYLKLGEEISDSLHQSAKKRVYANAEKGHVLALQGKLDVAERILLETSHIILNEDMFFKGQLIHIYKYLGDLYRLKNNTNLALAYYSKCVNFSNRQAKFIERKIEALDSLTRIYEELGNYKKAFELNKEYSYLNNQLFGSKSTQNRKLFEIKNEYLKALETQEKDLRIHKIRALEQESQVLRLRNTIFVILAILVLAIASLRFYFVRKRHIYQTKHLEEQKRLEAENNRRILEIKNKELTSTALKIISKDKLLLEIKALLNEVKEKTKEKVKVEQLVATIGAESKRNWQSFEMRFSAVNKDFYTQLKEKHPSLTPNDLKICAFIKLGLETKDIANLLGISHESLHTSRYRLRKKMNLKSTDDLDSTIISI